MIKDIFGSCLCLIDLFYIYIYCRKFSAEFNKLTKTVGHHAHFFFFSKKDVEYANLCQQF